MLKPKDIMLLKVKYFIITLIYSPNLDSTYFAVTPVKPLALYIPNAKRDKPPAAIKVLSQSESNAFAPLPKIEPAVLETKNLLTFKCSAMIFTS